MDYHSGAFTNTWLQDTDSWLQDTYLDPVITEQDDLYFGTTSPTFSWDDTYMSPGTSIDASNYLAHIDTKFPLSPAIEELPAQPSRSTSPETVSHVEKSKRRRGRPRGSHSDAPSKQTSTRTPHNQVERKYRDGLNAELDRLRMTIPSTARWESCTSPGVPKPSKAMVLACAIDYIREVERERDGLLKEMKMLRR